VAEVDPLKRWRENPFFLLAVAPGTPELEIEREGRKLLAQLELGLQAVRSVDTPLGPVERTPDNVRAALAELKDPRKRRAHALWARLRDAGASNGESASRALEPYAGAMQALGWPGL
jgi:hypothetical protein